MLRATGIGSGTTTPDPLLLPAATTLQIPLTSAYDSLNIPTIAAGGSYRDPTTGVKIYKLTSSVFPTSSPSWNHDYSEGGDEVSLPYSRSTRAVLAREAGGAYWLIDFTPGAGVGNARPLTGARGRRSALRNRAPAHRRRGPGRPAPHRSPARSAPAPSSARPRHGAVLARHRLHTPSPSGPRCRSVSPSHAVGSGSPRSSTASRATPASTSTPTTAKASRSSAVEELLAWFSIRLSQSSVVNPGRGVPPSNMKEARPRTRARD